MKGNPRRRWAMLVLVILVSANLWVWFTVWAGPGRLVVTFLDVGQGDAIVIQSPRGRVIVVDAGPVGETDDAGRRVVLPFLRSRGIGSVDALVLTHPHDDHVGGARSLLERVGVKRLLVSDLDSREPIFQQTLKLAREKGVDVATVRRGMRLDMEDGVTAEVLNPSDSTASSPNNGSVGLRLRYGNTAVLLAGDAEAEAESGMTAACDLRADVLKLSHHGSRTSTSPPFLAAVSPRAAVVSVGKRNVFGHPAPDVQAHLAEAHIPLFRTDHDGAITVESDGKQLAIRRTVR